MYLEPTSEPTNKISVPLSPVCTLVANHNSVLSLFGRPVLFITASQGDQKAQTQFPELWRLVDSRSTQEA